MKKMMLFTAAIFALCSVSHALPGINEKILKAFKEEFPKASEVNWYEQTEGCSVGFKDGDIRYNITYSGEGKVISTIRYYKEETLPPLIRIRMAERFPGLHIYGVTELTNEDGVSYHIVLEDAQSWYNISANGAGHVSEVKKFHKA